ncbi:MULTISPECIES: serine/threonine-protein kinase [Actinomadura]|uniref:Serine/threonine-protein kinase n=1 Tax=Actinomadura yumaensis TaxID=111807 RepID=A0ABW2CBG6_9ACTN|nr:serine/threonine-protein kinase [Actinomadura sp. J1-007]MWK33931.1 protein kinase [Actinomadura sp. J1-007]
MDATEHGGGAAPLVPGDPPAIGRFTLLGRLGAGGMGVVYLARDESGRRVAVKALRSAAANDPSARARFRAEAGYARRVASSWTARVIEDGSALVRPFIVSEYIEGPPLARVVERDGPLPAATVEAVAIGVAAALAAIHGAGLVHRDLKPANVLLARSGPWVIDFGIARAVDLAQGPTQSGFVMGSPGWIAPERLLGGPATPASDVFGWGCLVAYAATGRHPFGAGDGDLVAGRIVHLPPDLAGLPEPLHGLVSAAIAKDPSDRPSVDDLLLALLAARSEARTQRPPSAQAADGVETAPAGTAAEAIAALWQPPPVPPTDPPAATQDPRPPDVATRLPDGTPSERREERRRTGAPWLRAGLPAALASTAAVVAVAVAVSLDAGAGAGEPGRTVTRPPSGGRVGEDVSEGRAVPSARKIPAPDPPPNGSRGADAPGPSGGGAAPAAPTSGKKSTPPPAPSSGGPTATPTVPPTWLPGVPPWHGKPRKPRKKQRPRSGSGFSDGRW